MPIETDPEERSIKRHNERCAYGAWCKRTYTKPTIWVHFYYSDKGEDLYYVKIARYGLKPEILENTTKKQLLEILKTEGITSD
jgi:hypothetical protein